MQTVISVLVQLLCHNQRNKFTFSFIISFLNYAYIIALTNRSYESCQSLEK